MNPNDKYGRSEPGPINLLPAITLDMSEGQQLPSILGKSEVPVHLLPELVLDMEPAEPVPALQLSLSLRPGSAPEEVALDLLRLYAALNQLDLAEPGGGLKPDEAACEAAPGCGTMRITLTANNPDGAAERLSRLARLLTEAASKEESERPQYPSIVRCEAKVIPNAA